jgi:RNA polymerase sigma-70 factor (ECF subfamily)
MGVESAFQGPTDEELLGAVREGDSGALRELYERHAPWLLLRLSRRCADPNVVEEVVQDTFVAVWRGARRYRGQGEVAAWVWGIGIRRLIDRLRRSRVVPLLPERRGPEPSAEEQVLLGVEYGDLAGALNRLSPELRAALQATVLDGLTTREAARLLGIPAGTVKTRMMRARQQLREALT